MPKDAFTITMKHEGINHPGEAEQKGTDQMPNTLVFVEKPTRENLIRIMAGQQSIKRALRREEGKKDRDDKDRKFFGSPMSSVDRDIAINELRIDLKVSKAVYKLALMLCGLTDDEFERWNQRVKSGQESESKEWARVA